MGRSNASRTATRRCMISLEIYSCVLIHECIKLSYPESYYSLQYGTFKKIIHTVYYTLYTNTYKYPSSFKYATSSPVRSYPVSSVMLPKLFLIRVISRTCPVQKFIRWNFRNLIWINFRHRDKRMRFPNIVFVRIVNLTVF